MARNSLENMFGMDLYRNFLGKQRGLHHIHLNKEAKNICKLDFMW